MAMANPQPIQEPNAPGILYSNVPPEIDWCSDIGLFVVNRPRCASCVHATEYCRARCYNVNVERRFPATGGKDERNERAWQACNGSDYARALDRKKLFNERVRLMSRGEAFSTVDDIARVADIARANPGRIFWIPTRAWRNTTLRRLIETRLAILPNVSIQASLDPSNNENEWRDLKASGWSTIYFGDGAPFLNSGRTAWQGPTGRNVVKCPKTFRGLKGENACQRCKAGCFSPVLRGRRVDVELREH
jgi:hypothetical protein